MKEQRLPRSPLASPVVLALVVALVSLVLVLILAAITQTSLDSTNLFNALLADTVVAMFALIALYWVATRQMMATVPNRVQGGLEVSVQAVKSVTASDNRPRSGGRKVFGLPIGVVILIGVLFGIFIPFLFLPALHLAVALPVISVPGESLTSDPGSAFTNTLMGVLLADVMAIAFVVAAGGRLKQVPGRLQSMLEIIVEAFEGQARQMVGPKARSILPLALTIFFFLLFANWVELIPGVDSIGTMRCAEVGKSGYPTMSGVFLNVSKPLDTGKTATQEDTDACATLASGGQLTQDQQTRADLTAKLDAGTLTDAEKAIVGVAGTSGTTTAANTTTNTTPSTSGSNTSASAGTGNTAGSNAPVAPTSSFVPLRPNLHVVSSFVRAGATDLNLTVMLALVAFLVTEFYGIRAFGGRYFYKFINIPAFRKMFRSGVPAGQRAFAGIDIFVGLLEGVSELARILSYSFRLFGNLFAGQALLFVLSFLVGALIPVAIYLLELFVGFIQATVFALLLLMFTGMALSGGHGGDESDHEASPAEDAAAHAQAAAASAAH